MDTEKSPRRKSGKSDMATQKDDEYEASTQSLTQAEKHIRNMGADDLDRKVTDVVQYILVADQKKLPIKRPDITKNVLKEHSKAFPKIIEKAGEKLEKIFGFKLVEVEGKRYMLVNTLDETGDSSNSFLSWSEEEYSKMGLLTVILTAVFMKNGVMRDSDLYQMLRKLGVDVERPHEVFGDVKKLITQEFVKQLYLECDKVPKSEPPVFDFSWGPRALQELRKRSCLELVSEVYGNRPEAWAQQFEYLRKHEPVAEASGQDQEMVNGENAENERPRPGPSRSGRRK